MSPLRSLQRQRRNAESDYKHLEFEYASLQNEQSTLGRKLALFQNELRVVADASQKFALQEAIDQTEERFHVIRLRLEQIDEEQQKLEATMTQLTEQIRLFEESRPSISSFEKESDPDGPEQAELREKLSRYFSLGELKILAFDLGIDADNLGGSTKQQFIASLIVYVQNREMLHRLIEWARRERSFVQW